jgi:uncharacterized protein (TIGR02246 family)
MILSVLAVALLLQSAPATQPARAADEQAIRQMAAKYAEAYSRGDVDALVAQYAKDAKCDDGAGGLLVGRDEIRKNLEQTFKDSPGDKMTIDVKSIRFTKNRAIEAGATTLTPKKGEPTTTSYRAIHARQPDGTWLMTSVGPDVTAAEAGAGPLEDLAWMVGHWQDAAEGVSIDSVCDWSRNRRFLLRTFSVEDDDGTELTVSEVIGWDSADRAIRSWVFDSDGGFAQGIWRKRNSDWIISSKGTLADGGRSSAVNILHPIDKNSYTWSSTDRDVDGQVMPDVEDVKIVRVPETQPAAAEGGKP